VASFVRPAKVPQMADAEAVIAGLPLTAGVAYSALTLNRPGVERACRTAIPWIEVSLSASEAHSRSNTGLSLDQAMGEARAMLQLASQAGRKLRGSIQCAFGFQHEADVSPATVLRAARQFVDGGADVLVLADTAGLATPSGVCRLLEEILPMSGATRLALHLHDTRGLGLVNVMAGLQMGIAHFDSSLGGLGGCPFVPGAAGNIATEETVHLMHTLGIATGIDAAGVAGWSNRLSAYFGHPLPGKLYRFLSPPDSDPALTCPSGMKD
jgi:hydroxymethylglutaryl-CoA lyase